ncbi:MAG: hypothetical protein FJ034_03665, partial [Chloroflexi bacterium]|nr:hypothetical protein [Chloroflexota bacterium]
MKVSAAALTDLGDYGAVIVPVTDGALPPGLPRPVRARAAAAVDAGAMGSLYGVVTQFGASPERVVLVEAGKAEDATYERVRKVASAGIRALGSSTVRRAAIVLDPRT